MADEAFALSPISARAAAAERGGLRRDPRSASWRPRAAAGFSANTPSATAMPTPRMVLDAVARIEANLARRSGSASRPPTTGCATALAAIRRAIDDGQAPPPRRRSMALRWTRRCAAGPQRQRGSSARSPGAARNRRRWPDLRSASIPRSARSRAPATTIASIDADVDRVRRRSSDSSRNSAAARPRPHRRKPRRRRPSAAAPPPVG